MKRLAWILTCAFLWAGMAPLPGEAHKLSVFAYFEGDVLVGEAYFNRGNPAREVPVRVTSGELLLAQGLTDDKGAFSFPLKLASLQEIRVAVDAGMGHQALQILNPAPPAEEGALALEEIREGGAEAESSGLSEISSEMMREIVREELGPLKNLLLSLRKEQEKAGITEILGGIGYIFGLVGICMWYRGGRKRG